MPNKVTVFLRTDRQLTSPEAFNPGREVISADAAASGEISIGTDSAGALSDALNGLLNKDKRNIDESVTDGLLTVRGGRVTLKYREPWGSRILIEFLQSEPGLITVTRTDPDNSDRLYLTFEAGRRHISVCKKDGETFEVTSRALRIDNRLLQRGMLSLDYTVEIHGARAERTRMEIKLKNR